MVLNILELKRAAALLSSARQFVEEALAIAEGAADVAVQRAIKPLLARARDVQTEIEGRLKAAERDADKV